jgi:NAD(P)-dependent dehydrogenase (short-subunit alcohol dehydrogenase family)
MAETQARVAFITGGAGGIGRVTANKLAQEGYTVIVADVDDGGAAAAVAEIIEGGGSAESIHLDATKRDDVHAAIAGIVERHGRIDLSVNNAGLQHFAPLAEITEEHLNSLVNLNFSGYVWVTQATVEHIRRQGFGTIVNVASVSAFLGVPNSTIYSALKGAIVSFTRTLAAEVGPEQIRINAVAPGSVQTPGSSALHDPAAFERRAQKAAMKRLAQAEEVADAIIWLASDKASFVTGQTILIDGGAVGSL